MRALAADGDDATDVVADAHNGEPAGAGALASDRLGAAGSDRLGAVGAVALEMPPAAAEPVRGCSATRTKGDLGANPPILLRTTNEPEAGEVPVYSRRNFERTRPLGALAEVGRSTSV